ncbi:MAG: penicillin-binding protein 2 [Bowdeniella nasicola]|nr:penicillin-binding protein 2 [Bowdeniella nasicola]
MATSRREGSLAATLWNRIRRGNVLMVATTLLIIIALVRLLWLQVIDAPRLAEEGLNNRMKTFTITAPRGPIVDAEGNVLAVSTQVVHVGVNQIKVRDYVHKEPKTGRILGAGPAEAARMIAPILDQDPAQLGGMMVGDSTYRVLAKDLTPAQWREIADLRIPGIEPDYRSIRTYPNGNLAGNILGFVNKEGVASAGLELSFNKTLTGIPGKERIEVGASGSSIPTGVNEKEDAVPGSTVHLTILRDLQDVAQKAVQNSKDTFGASWAAAVVEEVGTGKILAIADSDTVNPNEYWKSSAENQGARSISAVYEPGSTGKLLTYAAAIDQGTVKPTTHIHNPSRYTTANGELIKDFSDHATEERTVAGVLMKSYNTGTVQIGETMSDQVRYEYFQRFGLGKTIDVGMPGQAAGILVPPEKWDGRQKYTTMFGQGYAVTLLQNVGVVQTLANKGVYVTPTLVAGTTDAKGTFHEGAKPSTHEVISADSASQMLLMMEGVTQKGGTGVRGAVEGYRVAAKTGTAQVAGPGGALTRTAGVFNAVIPADNPRLAVSVVVYNPSSGFQGGVVAAPVFKEIASFAVRYLGIPPSSSEPELYPVEYK